MTAQHWPERARARLAWPIAAVVSGVMLAEATAPAAAPALTAGPRSQGPAADGPVTLDAGPLRT